MAHEAADNVGSWQPKGHHLYGARGRKAKFGDGINPHTAVEEALRSPSARILPNNAETARPGSFVLEADLGRTVGSRGETVVKVVVGDHARVVTAYPRR